MVGCLAQGGDAAAALAREPAALAREPAAARTWVLPEDLEGPAPASATAFSASASASSSATFCSTPKKAAGAARVLRWPLMKLPRCL